MRRRKILCCRHWGLSCVRILEQGVFGDFHLSVMSNMIQGAIGEYMLNPAVIGRVDLETCSSELVRIIHRAVRA